MAEGASNTGRVTFKVGSDNDDFMTGEIETIPEDSILESEKLLGMRPRTASSGQFA